MKTRYYILSAVISYLFFTLASMPAATAFSLLKDNTNLPFTLQGIDGSIWNGSAQRLVISSAPQLENLNWQLNPLSLLLARLNVDVDADIFKNKLSGNITVNSNGEISASEVTTRLTGETVQKLIGLPLGEISGDFDIEIKSIELANNIPVINGTILWTQAKFTLADTVDLGKIELSIKPSDNKSLTATIKNLGGDIDIEGQVILSDNKAYKLDLTFKPQASANNNIKQSLAMFARRQTNGAYILKQNGNLNSLGF